LLRWRYAKVGWGVAGLKVELCKLADAAVATYDESVHEARTFELTMPVHDLMELLQRLHSEPVSVLVESGTEAQSSREDAEADRRFQRGSPTQVERLSQPVDAHAVFVAGIDQADRAECLQVVIKQRWTGLGR